MKKILSLFASLLMIILLTSCNKTANLSSKNLKSISIYNKDDIFIYEVDSDQMINFLDDFNNLTFQNHSSTTNLKKGNYLLFDYDKYQVKVTVSITIRIKDDNYTRNRNRLYDEVEFYNLIDQYK